MIIKPNIYEMEILIIFQTVPWPVSQQQRRRLWTLPYHNIWNMPLIGVEVRAGTSPHLSIIPAMSVCLCVCVSVTAVSRQPLVRSNWNLPATLLGTWVCAFSRFDINRTSASQVMAIYLPNQLRRRGRWGRDPQPRSPLRVTMYGLPESDDFVYSNNFSISYAHL